MRTPIRTTARRPLVVRVAFAAVTLLLGASAAVLVPGTAQAMTQIQGGSGYPGDTVSIQVRNDALGPAFSSWTLSAPAGTTITGVASSNPPGLGQFACRATQVLATCGPAAGGGWGRGNQVTLTLQVAATAPAGSPSGTSTIQGGESGQFSVTVLAPPAPTITAPATGTRTLAAQPTIQGTKRAGNGASVRIDGAVVCALPQSAGVSWTCTPPTALAPGAHAITATQTSPGGDTSTVSPTTTVTVLEPAALTVVQGGATGAVPTVPIERTITVTNTGPGAATTTAAIGLGSFPATTCRVSAPFVPGVVHDSSSDPVTACTTIGALPLGLVPAGQQVLVTVDGTVPQGTAPGTVYTIAASVRSENDAASPVASSATVQVTPPPVPTITAPANGTSTSDRRPLIAGGDATPGATVTVTRDGAVVCSVGVDVDGRWGCSPTEDLPLGAATFTVTQTIGGSTSAASAATVIDVLAPPPPPGNETGGSGSGGTGGVGAGGPRGSGSAGTGPVAPRPVTPQPVTPQPVTPQSAAPQPAPSPGPAPAPVTPGGGSSTGGGSGAGNGPLSMDLRFAQDSMAPGTVASMRGTLGPNASAETVTIDFSGRVTQGMQYRDVLVAVDEQNVDCQLTTTSFSCTVPLRRGQSADVEVRLFADAVNAPSIARQQLAVASSSAAQTNAMTSTIAVGDGPTDTEQLADAITTFTVTTFPGAFIPLLSMLLLGLAAFVVETGRRRAAGAAGTDGQAAAPPPEPPTPPDSSTPSDGSPQSPRPPQSPQSQQSQQTPQNGSAS